MEAPFSLSKVVRFHLQLLCLSILIYLLYSFTFQVDSLIIDAGERYDFVVNADQQLSSYWIRLHGHMDCGSKKVFQAAILRYMGAPEIEPEEVLTFENTERFGKVIFKK